MALQKDYLGNEKVETIYFGGGTPSLLEAQPLKKIIDSLYASYEINTSPEITLEANPDDIDKKKLCDWKNTGINRLSIGVQSFFEEDLIWMNRAHSGQQAVNCIKTAQGLGFENITIDLIYGLPTLTNEKWQNNLDRAAYLQVQHLSCYALTVEQKTPLHKMIRQRKADELNADRQAEQFFMLMDFADNAGYEQYEISNFAQPGKRSRHNSSYWQGKKYLGLGPSAHSYNGLERRWNIANNQRYVEALNHGKVLFEKEDLSTVQKLNEYIMLSLRTAEGCNLNYIEANFGRKAKETIVCNANAFTKNGKINLNSERMLLTREGKLFADKIASDLFF